MAAEVLPLGRSSRAADPEATPRKKLGKHLRLVRQSAAFTTMAPFARELRVSVDLISKIETAKHVPTQDIFLAWLDLCQVSEEARVYLTDIWILARASYGSVPESIEKWFENEGKAAFLRLWGLLFMPAQLQTRDYARAMFLAHGMDEDEATDQADIRIGRQAILDRLVPAYVTATIHERALHNLVGAPEVMISQLEHLLEMSKRRNVLIQVIRDTGYFVGMDGAFEVVSGDEIPDTLLMQTLEEQASEDRTLTRKAIEVFEQIRGYALNVEGSRAFIEEAIERWKSRLQQAPAGASPATAARAAPGHALRQATSPARSSSATPLSTALDRSCG
jgi:transcriptional regulator with XRE-family HTH domain